MVRKVSIEQEKKIVAYYKNHSIHQTSLEWGISVEFTRRILEKNHVKVKSAPKNNLTSEEFEKVVKQDYISGLSVDEISVKYGRMPGYVKQLVNKGTGRSQRKIYIENKKQLEEEFEEFAKIPEKRIILSDLPVEYVDGKMYFVINQLIFQEQ